MNQNIVYSQLYLGISATEWLSGKAMMSWKLLKLKLMRERFMNLINMLLKVFCIKLVRIGAINFSIDSNGDLFLVGQEVTLPIKKVNAKSIFGGGYSNDPNNGLFPMSMDKGGKKVCLSLMPDDVAKTVLTKEQVSAIKRALQI